MDAATLAPLAERPGEPAPFLPGIEPEPSARPPAPQNLIDDDEPAEFDWFKDDSVVVEEQPSIAVYRNRRNHLIIRSQGNDFDEDKFVFVATLDALRLLVAALQRELKEWR